MSAKQVVGSYEYPYRGEVALGRGDVVELGARPHGVSALLPSGRRVYVADMSLEAAVVALFPAGWSWSHAPIDEESDAGNWGTCPVTHMMYACSRAG